MSYVFSKALQETPEERERRKSVPPKWSVPPASQMKSKVPPPVARKPSTGAPKHPASTSTHADVAPSQRKISLPARTSSFDGDYGTGPKMGGAFARLQANLEKDEDQKGSSSIYSDVYEAYKIKRSLKEHGCLPSNMRNDERLRKYSLDKTAPPVVMPKPKRSTADSKRHAFGANRSMTTPTTPTANYFTDDVFSHDATMQQKDKAEEVKPSPPSTNIVVKPSPPTTNIEPLDFKIDELPQEQIASPENIQSPKSPFGDPDEIKKLESSNDVQAMKAAIEQEKSKQIEEQRKLSETISELDSISFDDLSPNQTNEENILKETTANNEIKTISVPEDSKPQMTSEENTNEPQNVNEIVTQAEDTKQIELQPDKSAEESNASPAPEKAIEIETRQESSDAVAACNGDVQVNETAVPQQIESESAKSIAVESSVSDDVNENPVTPEDETKGVNTVSESKDAISESAAKDVNNESESKNVVSESESKGANKESETTSLSDTIPNAVAESKGVPNAIGDTEDGTNTKSVMDTTVNGTIDSEIIPHSDSESAKNTIGVDEKSLVDGETTQQLSENIDDSRLDNNSSNISSNTKNISQKNDDSTHDDVTAPVESKAEVNNNTETPRIPLETAI